MFLMFFIRSIPDYFPREAAPPDDDESLAKHKLQNYRKLPSEILERNFPPS
jgi:hypothetical protein